ncbi:MAG: hypothetical protein HWN66_03315 [Candidatus Helarchaeota archaeon]|nr:hypothetical protein [Candidatus Helarchaeota archaeon]
MIPFDNILTLTLTIQSIIWFILAGYLIFLALTNKLTHIDEFRQKFVMGIFSLVICVTFFILIQVFRIFPEEFYNVGFGIIFLGQLIFLILVIIAISKLVEYITSIIDFENETYKKKAILISLILSIIPSILRVIIQEIDQSTIITYFAFPIILFFYLTFSSFFVHQELKTLKLNTLLYIGIGFLSMACAVTFSIYFNIVTDVTFWVIFFFGLIFLNLFLILGYLDFKNRISALKK